MIQHHFGRGIRSGIFFFKTENMSETVCFHYIVPISMENNVQASNEEGGGVAIFNENPTVVISWGEGSTSDQVHHESPLQLKTLQSAPSGPSLDRFGGPKAELNP